MLALVLAGLLVAGRVALTGVPAAATDVAGPPMLAAREPAPRQNQASPAAGRPRFLADAEAVPRSSQARPAEPGAVEAMIEPVEMIPSAASSPPSNARTIRMLVTAYCPCRKCCGKFADGITASGRSVLTNGARFVAADTRILPFHTRISVPGYHDGLAVPVLDRGRRIKGRRLDVFFPSHAEAKAWGARWLDVTVYEE